MLLSKHFKNCYRIIGVLGSISINLKQIQSRIKWKNLIIDINILDMSVSTLFNESMLSALESYALTQDKKAYLQSLPEGIEKKVLNALTLPYTTDIKQKLIDAGIPQGLAIEICDRKHLERIFSAKSAADIQDIITQLKKSLSSYFSQTKPLQQNRMQSQIPVGSQPSTIKRLPSKLHLEDGDNLQKYLVSLIKENQDNIRVFSDYAIRNLPEDILLNLRQQNKGILLSKYTLLPTFNQEFVAKFYKIFIETQRKTHLDFQLPIQCYNILPAGHINKLAEVIPMLTNSYPFLTIWFSTNYQKKYPVLTTANSKLTISQKDDKRAVLLKVLQHLHKQKKLTHDVLAKQIQLQLLNLDLSMEDAHLQRFIKYLETVRQSFPIFNENYRRQINQSGKSYNNVGQVLKNLSSANLSVDNFLEQYITALLKKYEVSKFEQIEKSITKFVDEKRFRRLKVKVLLARGLGLEESDKTLTESQKIQIRQKKQLTICDNNKNTFKVDQEVVLKIKIKNVNRIVVKIYEINLQKHYIQKKTEIEDNMDLHFLDPTYQFIYEIESKNPFKQQIYDMAIKQIKKERGVYVVDLDGSGISSRAVIRKGAVFCLKRITLAGLQIKFYDESGKKIENLSIWLRGQPISIKGSYILPFGQQQQSVSIIAVVGDYAQLFNITIPNQSYRLEVAAYYNQQSFIVGGKAKIILNPRLYINQAGKEGQTPISLKLLKNVRINVLVEDYQFLKSTISLQNVNWSYEQDYVIQIPIQNYVRSINISGTAQISKYNGKKEDLSFCEIISIYFNDQLGQNQCFKDFYLKKINGNYILHVLGMDGERLTRSLVHLNIKIKWVQKITGHDLESDQNGQINLGPLHFVEYISVQPNNKTWKIGTLEGQSQMLRKMCFKQGQLIHIPLPPVNYKYEIGPDVNIFYMGQQSYLQNMNGQVKVNDGHLEIHGLPAGTYRLAILSLNFVISIVVLKGKQWQNKNQIYNQDSSTVYQFIRNSNHYLALSDPTIQKAQGDARKVTIKIKKPAGVELNNNIKAHIFGLAFIPNRLNINSISEITQSDIRSQTFKSKGNTFLSNKKLSQQASYVLNRKNQKQFVGNNLEKPHILLNRIKVRDTVQKDEQMTGQTEFNKKRQIQRDAPADLLDISQNAYYIPPSSSIAGCPIVIQQINSHNNFLAHSGLTIQNVKGDLLQFVVPHYYSFVSVVLVSNNSKITRNYYLQKSKLETKKISHTGLQRQQKQNEAWSMSRQIYPISKGDSKKISRTSKWCAISLLNVIQFAKAQNIFLNAWVEKWSTYSQETKLDAFNKKACHELNNFIKHQDQPFFNKIVGPYIRNKINKTFVDLCLLEDPTCQVWSSLQYFDQLNPFEKVLLIEYLAKKGKLKQAESLASSMELLQKTNKYTYNDFKEKFETMINAEIKQQSADPMAPYIPPVPMQPQFQQYSQIPQVYQQQMVYNNYNNNNNAAFAFSTTTSATGSIQPVPPPPPPGMGGMNAAFAPMYMNSVANKNSRSNARMPAPVTATLQSYSNRAAMLNTQNSFDFGDQLLQLQNQAALIEQRGSYVQAFKEVQKTQQFTQVTYDQFKSIAQNTRTLVPQSKFWVDLALYFAKGKNKNEFIQQQFVSQSIIYLADRRSFTLAVAFLPKSLNADYQIAAQEGNVVLTANKPFLLFIKEIKLVPFNPRAGLMINHRFFDPSDQYSYQEDGTAVEKQVDEFIMRKQYSLQTLVTNTTGNSLQIQLLVDTPQGSIPLGTKQYTQITNYTISPYSTQSFDRKFYFPNEGQYTMYPANVCCGKNVIAKSGNLPKINVKARRTTKKLQTFLDVLAEGEDDDIIKYLETKNIFDTQIFRSHQILWMLKDKSRFQGIVKVLRSRGYINTEIWRFGILHEDIQTIKQFFILSKNKKPTEDQNCLNSALKVFQYYPYYSSRTHKYENQNKSKIRNVQFKQTFYRFLFEQIAYFGGSQKPNFKLAAAYYLLLQDRVDEASKLVQTLKQEDKKLYKLQFDYLECFLDMYEGFPNFTKARKICAEYTDYPVISWRTLFNQIQSTLKNYDNAVDVEGEDKKVEYRTSVLNEGDSLKISIPAGTKVELLIYSINLELLFSNNPFVEIKACSSVKPARILVYDEENQYRQQRFKRPQDFKDVIVEIFKSGKTTNQRKVDTILWTNPSLKSKINEKKGSLQIFYKNKPISGCYCKVYSSGSKGERFYRDGYTDITGTFKYALSELKDITLFSILSVTDYGGIISKIAPPSQAGELNQ